TASNVITYLARGNVALSVTMTTCSTLAAPFMTPLCMKLLAGQYVPIAFWPMMLSILNMIVVPVLIGVALNRIVHNRFPVVLRYLPFVAMLAICTAIALTVALSREELLAVGIVL